MLANTPELLRLEFETARWRRLVRKMDEALATGHPISAAVLLHDAREARERVQALEDAMEN
jgi:hypothetical protein